MSSERRARTESLAALLAQSGLDLLLVTGLADIRYLTGFSGANAICLVGAKYSLFITDFRYREQARTQVTEYEVIVGEQDLTSKVAGRAADQDASKVGFDPEGLSYSMYVKLREALPDGIELVDAGSPVKELRAVKDSGEVEKIKRAAALATSSFEKVMDSGIVGLSERDVAWRLESAIREGGAQALPFTPIVAASQNGALPHAQPRDEKIEEDTLVVIDWGCVYHGYCSDCTRTVATGEITSEMETVYETVKIAQREALRSVAPSTPCKDVDETARRVITSAGYGENFGHGTGHGVGLEVHERPRLARDVAGELECGNVVTIEPGIYIPGCFGVRIEDLVLVTEDGSEILTGASRELRIVN